MQHRPNCRRKLSRPDPGPRPEPTILDQLAAHGLLVRYPVCDVRGREVSACYDVNASGLAKTRMAKSVLDAGWSMFREMLRYKALRHGASFEVADEYLSTQACSDAEASEAQKVSQVLE